MITKILGDIVVLYPIFNFFSSMAFLSEIDNKRGTICKCKEYSRIDFCSKKRSKSLQNTLFYALVSIICGRKPLITTNKLVGPVGKKGVLGGVYTVGCEMHEKPQKT